MTKSLGLASGRVTTSDERPRRGAKCGRGSGLIVWQAFRQHKIVHIFDRPGSSDLTANVDFKYLQEALAGTGECDHEPRAGLGRTRKRC